ncbi:MAG: 2-succinyl-5-enolpyruvyl-6-hydroxy-3-cyclohexene-1-carboxylic-acid synthase [Ilumatobacteraceae bacterium]
MTTSPAITATFCATLVDEWIRLGLRHAVISPGSRSTPMALALASRGELSVHVFHDERSASFAALGIGIESELPAILLCTSGTAAVQFHAAVVEAHHAEVPMLICTADRPPELQGVGAPQTIDQRDLYGVATRKFIDVGIADSEESSGWRDLAQTCLEAACGESPGPVHLNFPFREPLIGDSGELPRVSNRKLLRSFDALMPKPKDVDEVVRILRGKRGVLIAGAGCKANSGVQKLAQVLRWPILADPRSGCRVVETNSPVVIAGSDTFLRSEPLARSLSPEVILRLGEPPVSKVVNLWLRDSGATYIAISATPRLVDPDRIISRHLVGSVSAWCLALVDRLGQVDTRSTGDSDWLTSWQRAESITQREISASLLEEKNPTEPAISRALSKHIPDGSRLVVSSSMPVRDLEWFSEPRDGLPVHANRGASGIDGVVSTAVGIALASHAPTYLLIGDLAMLHDSNGLVGLSSRRADVRIICIDNHGGGIFSFLPQANSLNTERFDQLFGTPHSSDIALLASAHGISSKSIDSMDEFVRQVGETGSWLICVATDRVENVAVHDRLNANVLKALASIT